MTHLRFHIRFPEGNIREPILYQVGREYHVVTDIRRADVRETIGWADVELSGDTVEIERGHRRAASQRLWRRSDRIKCGGMIRREAYDRTR